MIDTPVFTSRKIILVQLYSPVYSWSGRGDMYNESHIKYLIQVEQDGKLLMVLAVTRGT
jgi:hypothetical protein